MAEFRFFFWQKCGMMVTDCFLSAKQLLPYGFWGETYGREQAEKYFNRCICTDGFRILATKRSTAGFVPALRGTFRHTGQSTLCSLFSSIESNSIAPGQTGAETRWSRISPTVPNLPVGIPTLYRSGTRFSLWRILLLGRIR